MELEKPEHYQEKIWNWPKPKVNWVRHYWLRRFVTLRWRLTLLNAALITVLGIGLGLIIYLLLQNFLYDNLRSRLQDYAITQTYLSLDKKTAGINRGGGRDSRGGNDGGRENNISSLTELAQFLATKREGGVHSIVLDSSGQVVAGTNSSSFSPSNLAIATPLPTPEQLRQATSSGAIYYTTSSNSTQYGPETMQVYLLVVRNTNGPIYTQSGVALGYVMLAASVKPAQEVLNEIRFLLISGFACLVLLTILTGYPLTRLGLHPLKKVTQLAQQLRISRLDQRVPLPDTGIPAKVARQDEIWQLVVEFNTMLDKLEKAFAAQKANEIRMRQFVADASHELRSPLTVLGGYLEVLQMGASTDPAQTSNIICSLKQEVDRLSHLVVDLLLLTRLDAREKVEVKHLPLDLEELLSRALINMKIVAAGKEVALELVTLDETGIWVSGDSEQLYRVLVNLLDNAIRYSSRGGKIQLSLNVENDDTSGEEWAVVGVRDWGSGIATDQLPLIFNRFYRADKARNRESGNTGLGLAISQGIVEAHHGTITVESKAGEGSCFSIRLPLLGVELEPDTPQTPPLVTPGFSSDSCPQFW
jgi:signal transduction histidine kinase